MSYLIQSREQYEYNTDPQSRCYYGSHAKSEWVWSNWCTLGSVKTENEAQESVDRWTNVNKNCGRRLEYRWVKNASI